MFTSPKLRAPFQIVRGTKTKLPAQDRSTTLLQPIRHTDPMVTARPPASSRPFWAGLAELGPVDPFSGDLSLELGISVWLRRSGTSLVEARGTLLEIRQVILEVCGLDPATEPVPLVGRSPRADV